MQGYVQRSFPEVFASLRNRIDLILEASPVNIKTGEPGLSIVRAALNKGIHVVLANKGPVVLAYHELSELARQNNVKMMFSATCCGGMAVINTARNMVAADIISIRGVFNSTTNFILAEMAKDREYSDALKEAQIRGIAETDPSLDVEGWDTANKLLIISYSILNLQIPLRDIQVEGITKITKTMIHDAEKEGKVYKLVATASRKPDGSYALQVKPLVLDRSDSLATTDGWEMGIEIKSDLFETTFLKVWERESVPTASAMLRDAVNILNDTRIAV
eukprot:TRINITY_DN2621_c0_g1_i2.p1 TRINITY_DN2621_c0_g1~~TRINITY_DN2621_c0_g1_i2.p1  ORF type:complete len:276 (+),score=59.75 TRINITY_DN2621_c0_g1_i2:277-1104(+)